MLAAPGLSPVVLYHVTLYHVTAPLNHVTAPGLSPIVLYHVILCYIILYCIEIKYISNNVRRHWLNEYAQRE